MRLDGIIWDLLLRFYLVIQKYINFFKRWSKQKITYEKVISSVLIDKTIHETEWYHMNFSVGILLGNTKVIFNKFSRDCPKIITHKK